MAIWDRFKRGGQKSVLPDEVKQYYQSEKRQKRGVAIGLAVLALLATIAVAAGLFFGGRFIYHKVKGNDDKKQPASSQSDTSKSPAQKEGPDTKASSPQPAQNTPTPAPAPAPSAPAPSSNTTTPALGDEALPHTGDEGM
jgi:cytoskeletal protein RodZ